MAIAEIRISMQLIQTQSRREARNMNVSAIYELLMNTALQFGSLLKIYENNMHATLTQTRTHTSVEIWIAL